MEENKITLSSIGGYEYQKKEALKVINFFLNYKEYTAQGARLPSGLFFYGAPGNGKTMFANAIANESKVEVVYFNDKTEDERISVRIDKAFKLAEEKAPCILIIDEIDQLVDANRFGMSKPSDKQREALSALLTNIDTHKSKGILIIATANCDIRDLPAALVRNGRIEKHISIGHPDYQDRKAILELYLRKNNVFDNISSAELAKITRRVSCSGLSTLVNDVLIKSLSENIDKVKMDHFTEPLQVILSNGVKNKSTSNKDHVIYHEIGHFVVDYVLNGSVGLLTTESFGNAEGTYTRMGKFRALTGDQETEDEAPLLTYKDYFNRSICAISGLVATEIFMGKKYAGASKDLEMISVCFMELVANGLINDDELIAFTYLNSTPMESPYKDTSFRVTEALAKYISQCRTHAHLILSRHKDFIMALFAELKNKRTMSAQETQEFIDKHSDLIHMY